MSSWLIGIIGVIFLAVLFDFVYPNGKTNNFCKSMFGLFAIVMMVTPILKIDLSQDFSNSFVDNSLNLSLQNSKDEYYILKIVNCLKNNDIEGIDVEIESNMEDNVYQIENIYVDTTNIVLSENLTHTNKYEVIIQSILKIVEIDKERIVIYG